LIVVGDVSGKGLKAAMKATLLLGAMRALASEGLSPAVLLTRLNRDMSQMPDGGFITCLALRADIDGTVTVANAGHIPPYVDGKEMPLENGLPLGLMAEASYVESTFHVALGQQITLMTDGVVEARDKAGTLFGFERTAKLSVESAEAIARTAQSFGQDDDITALTLMVTA
jgi:serine phosphatase RsbU (regulator of sigma subunit)